MGTFYRHPVSITQDHSGNHGDDAMPYGRIAIKQCNLEVNRL